MSIEIKVKTNQPKNKIRKQGNSYLVCVKESPEKGRANLAIIKLFKKELKKDVRIVSGFKSREKMLRFI